MRTHIVNSSCSNKPHRPGTWGQQTFTHSSQLGRLDIQDQAVSRPGGW